MVTLLGANGAGKSTTLRTISGLIDTASGEIWFEGKRIDELAPEAIVRMGISHVPEGRRIFPGLTVRENIMLGSTSRGHLSKPADGARTSTRCSPSFPTSSASRTRWAGRCPAGSSRCWRSRAA